MHQHMPIRAAPYQHQQQAFAFAMRLFMEGTSPGLCACSTAAHGRRGRLSLRLRYPATANN